MVPCSVLASRSARQCPPRTDGGAGPGQVLPTQPPTTATRNRRKCLLKAVLFPGDSTTSLVHIDRPTPTDDDVLVRLLASGVCGTDVHYWHESPSARGTRRSIVPGHEAVGVVEAVGPATERTSPGDHVVVGMLHIGCGWCAACAAGNWVHCPQKDVLGRTLHGSYGEFVCVPERAIYKLPQGLQYSVAVLAACNLATAFSAVKKARIRPSERLIVFGLGAVGLSAVLVGAQSALEVLAVDPIAERRAKAVALGATWSLHPDEFTEEVEHRWGAVAAGAVLECSGQPTAQHAAIEALAPGGRAILVAMGGRFDFPPERLIAMELTLTGSAVCRPDDFYAVLAFASKHQDALASLLGPTLVIDQAQEGLKHSASGGSGKVVFTWAAGTNS